MKIEVNQPYEYPQDLAVIVEGECNHADYDYENSEDETFFAEGGEIKSIVIKSTLMVCNKCKAWKNEHADVWEGITSWPMYM